MGVWRGGFSVGGLAWGVWRGGFGMGGLAWGVWRGGFGVGGLASGVWRRGFGIGGLASGVWRQGFGVGGLVSGNAKKLRQLAQKIPTCWYLCVSYAMPNYVMHYSTVLEQLGIIGFL